MQYCYNSIGEVTHHIDVYFAKPQGLVLNEVRRDGRWLCYVLTEKVHVDTSAKAKKEEEYIAEGMTKVGTLKRESDTKFFTHKGKLDLCKYMKEFIRDKHKREAKERYEKSLSRQKA